MATTCFKLINNKYPMQNLGSNKLMVPYIILIWLKPNWGTLVHWAAPNFSLRQGQLTGCKIKLSMCITIRESIRSSVHKSCSCFDTIH